MRKPQELELSILRRKRRGFKPMNFGKIDFVIDENGDVKVIPLNVPAENLSGILHREGMPTASLEDMEQAIIEGASDWTRFLSHTYFSSRDNLK